MHLYSRLVSSPNVPFPSHTVKHTRMRRHDTPGSSNRPLHMAPIRSNILTGCSVSLASYVDPTKPRLQPEAPTNVDLPNYRNFTSDAQGPSDWDSEDTRPDFRHRYTNLRRPGDVTGRLLYDFNFDISLPRPIKDLIPTDFDGHSYVPLTDENVDVSTIAESTRTCQPAFTARYSELKCDNDLIYRTVCRAKLPAGVERIRLTSFRNFFSALEGMSEHWETDMDYYFISGQELDDDDDDEPELEPKLPQRPPHSGGMTGPVSFATAGMFSKRATTSSGIKRNGVLSEPEDYMLVDSKNIPEMPLSPKTMQGGMSLGAQLRSAGLVPPRSLSTHSSTSDSSSEADLPIPMYRGRRISSGIKMPGLYRTETVKGFLEAAIFNFNCKLSLPRAPATLLICGVRVPVRHQTFLVHRVPSDRQTAKSGIVEGPVLGSFVRQDVEAYSEGTEQQRKERLQMDLLREMGCLLHVAQERRRQGRQERVWTKPTPPAGHWFSEMASDKSVPDDSLVSLLGSTNGMGHKAQKVKTKYEMWKDMQPQRAIWDAKIKYMAIGKDDDSDWDEVSDLKRKRKRVHFVNLISRADSMFSTGLYGV